MEEFFEALSAALSSRSAAARVVVWMAALQQLRSGREVRVPDHVTNVSGQPLGARVSLTPDHARARAAEDEEELRPSTAAGSVSARSPSPPPATGRLVHPGSVGASLRRASRMGSAMIARVARTRRARAHADSPAIAAASTLVAGAERAAAERARTHRRLSRALDDARRRALVGSTATLKLRAVSGVQTHAAVRRVSQASILAADAAAAATAISPAPAAMASVSTLGRAAAAAPATPATPPRAPSNAAAATPPLSAHSQEDAQTGTLWWEGGAGDAPDSPLRRVGWAASSHGSITPPLPPALPPAPSPPAAAGTVSALPRMRACVRVYVRASRASVCGTGPLLPCAPAHAGLTCFRCAPQNVRAPPSVLSEVASPQVVSPTSPSSPLRPEQDAADAPPALLVDSPRSGGTDSAVLSPVTPGGAMRRHYLERCAVRGVPPARRMLRQLVAGGSVDAKVCEQLMSSDSVVLVADCGAA